MEEYLAGLGMGGPLVERSLAAVEDARKLLPEEIERIFLTEYRDEEGNRHYENLWLFTPKYISELRTSQVETGADVGFDIVSTRPGLVRIDVEREHFDLEEPSEQSRLTVSLSFPPSGSSGLSGTLRASGSNCTQLAALVQETLVPLL